MSTPNSPALIFPKADLSACTILPYTQNADGSWTAVNSGAFASGAASLLGYLDSVVLNIEQQNLEAISVDASYMNRIPTILDATAVLTENMRRQQGAGSGGASAADPGVIASVCIQYGMVKLSWAYNKGTVHNDIYTMYGLWRRYTAGVQGIGIQKAGFMIELLDTSYTTVGGVSGVAPISVVRS